AIDLRKEIPIGAGLGGGSSDAGAVLRMMAALCRVDDLSRLAEVALALGADVPFFLDPQVAHVGGVGERIAPLEIDASGDRALLLEFSPVRRRLLKRRPQCARIIHEHDITS